ncbi:hypothetical protein ACFL3T_04785 [Patescibacteria group bacterium]
MYSKGQELPIQDPQIPVFQQELQLKALWEGKCVAIELNGEITKGAIVEVKHAGNSIIVDFVGAYSVECPADDFHPLIIGSEEVKTYLSELGDEKGLTIVRKNLKARFDRLMN